MNRLLAAAHRAITLVSTVKASREIATDISAHDRAIAEFRRQLRQVGSGATVFGDEHVLTGNADLQPTDWLGPVSERPMQPLPGREHLIGADLDLIGGAA